jgi:hypothetical protein
MFRYLGGLSGDAWSVQCVERFLHHYAGDAAQVNNSLPRVPLRQVASKLRSEWRSCDHRRGSSAPVCSCVRETIRARHWIYRPSMRSIGLLHGAKRNSPPRTHSRARSRSSTHWHARTQAHAQRMHAHAHLWRLTEVRQERIDLLVERGLPHSLPTGSVPHPQKVELRGRDRRGRPIVWCVACRPCKMRRADWAYHLPVVCAHACTCVCASEPARVSLRSAPIASTAPPPASPSLPLSLRARTHEC